MEDSLYSVSPVSLMLLSNVLTLKFSTKDCSILNSRKCNGQVPGIICQLFFLVLHELAVKTGRISLLVVCCVECPSAFRHVGFL